MSNPYTARRVAGCDFAADSPLTYEQLATANKARTLVAVLVRLTPQQRVAAAAVVAERRGISISDALGAFGRLMDEAADQAAKGAA